MWISAFNIHYTRNIYNSLFASVIFCYATQRLFISLEINICNSIIIDICFLNFQYINIAMGHQENITLTGQLRNLASNANLYTKKVFMS